MVSIHCYRWPHSLTSPVQLHPDNLLPHLILHQTSSICTHQLPFRHLPITSISVHVTSRYNIKGSTVPSSPVLEQGFQNYRTASLYFPVTRHQSSHASISSSNIYWNLASQSRNDMVNFL